MGRNDQQAIEDLFDKLADAERQSGPRDREAEAFIRSAIGRQPSSPYYMAQTIIVQQQALDEARRRLGEGVPQRRNESRYDDRRSASGPWGGGGGFLAGAAQTAMGVAGGVLLGNLIGGALFGNSANAQESDNNDSNDSNNDVADAGDAGDFDGGGFDA